MKRVSLILKILILFSFPSAGQTGWSWLNPKPQGNTLRKVQALNSNLAFAIGDAGTIIRTQNAGAEWKVQRSRTNLNLKALSFVHPDSGFVVGDSGIILKTVNSGTAWFRQNSGTLDSLNSVFFVNSKIGWVSGANGLVLKTTNGGQTWQNQNTQTANSLNRLFFISSLIGWVGGNNGTIAKTTDGGSNWFPQTSPVSANINDIIFQSANIGFAIGSTGTILKTTNGGTDWVQQNSNTTFSLNSISILPSDTLLIAGGSPIEDPLLLKTVDGGENWFESNSFPDQKIYGLSNLNFGVGFGVGQSGYIFKSTDGFESGENLKSGFNFTFYNSWFLSADTGFVCGFENLQQFTLRTVNGGQSWDTTNFNSGLSISFDIQFVSPTIGYLCGTNGKVFKTSNRGSNWIETGSLGTTNTIRSLSFVSPDTGFAVGQNNGIYRTNNAGQNWESQTSATPQYLYKVFFVSSQTGYAAGENGIQKTSNGGNLWVQQHSGDTINSMFFFNALSGIAVGNNGLVLKTNNGGTNWNPQELGTNLHLEKVHFSNSQQGLIAGERGIVFRTIDGGNSWIKQLSYTNLNLFAAFLVNDTVGYIAGVDGTILKTTTGGSTCPDALFNYTGVFLPGKFCQNDTLTQSLYFDGTPGGTFSANPPGLNINPTTGIINPILSTPGNYSVQYQVTPPNGCPTQNFSTTAAIQTLQFIPRAKLEVTRPPYALPPETPFVPCKGDTMLTKARNKFADLGFAWYKNNQLLPDTTQEIKVTTSGLYAVKYRDQACAGPFYDTVQIDFATTLRPAEPGISITNPPLTCNDDFTLATPANTNVTYQWVGEPANSLLAGQSANTLTTSRVGTYRIQIDSLGCKRLSGPITQLPIGADTVLPTLFTVSTKGTDIPTERNEVKWNRITYDTSEIKRVIVYRVAEGEFFYTPIAEIPASDSVYLDEEVLPGNRAYSYRISAKQLCGTELFYSPSSELLNSINLKITNHAPNNFILRWTEPKEYSVRKYTVLRGQAYNNLTILSDSVPSDITTFIDNPPGVGPWFYRIEAQTDKLYQPWGRIQAAIRKSSSNTGNTTLSVCDSCGNETQFAPFPIQSNIKIFPNPHRNGFFIGGLNQEQFTELKLFDNQGKQLQQQRFCGAGQYYFNPNLKPGLYLLFISTEITQKQFRIWRE